MARTTLKIDTVLSTQRETDDAGGLLLTNVLGQEGISTPYAYDLMIYRPIGVEFPDLHPLRLLNSRATIGMRGNTDEYAYRTGFFQNFEKDTTNQVIFADGRLSQTDFRVYRGRLVPGFKMLDFDLRYRVFENKTVMQIIKEVMAQFPKFTPTNYINERLVNVESFEKIPYCVQYNETSFNFLNRMMAQFDIWYYFDHPQPGTSGQSETMVLGTSQGPFYSAKTFEMDVVYTGPKVTEIAGFQRFYTPAHTSVLARDFNMLNPTSVPFGTANVDDGYVLLPNEGKYTFEREVFPSAFTKTTATRMNDQAQSRMQDDEPNVFMVQGQTKNPTFMAGRLFHIERDETKANVLASFPDEGVPANGHYLIAKLTFSAFEHAIGHSAGQDVTNFLLSPVRWLAGLFRDHDDPGRPYMDATSTLAGNTMSNWFVNSPPKLKTLWDSFRQGAGATSVTGLAQMFVADNIAEIISRHQGIYTNAFVALPWDGKPYNQIPSPDAPKPKAYGPHLAVVVGHDGLKSPGNIYADALGRVRVRFPWQGKVYVAGHDNTGGFPEIDAEQPLKSDQDTAWVPISEGWAGTKFGTQFLPRIGQEVLVSFLDGDPDRPVITGRIYHADTGSSHLPFPNTPESFSTEGELPNTAGNYPVPLSGIKTSSIVKPQNGKERYHLLRFDDTYNCEQVLLRSQGRLDITAFSNGYYTTYGTQHIHVLAATDKNGKKFGGNAMTTIAGEYDLHVGASRYEAVEKDYQLTVKGDTSLDFKGKLTAVVDGVASIGADTVVIEATNKITLKVGGSFIVLGPCGVYIKGPLIYENSGGSPDSSAAVTMLDVGDADLAEPGDYANVRTSPCIPDPDPHGGGGGGGRNSKTDKIVPAPPCTQNTGSVDCQWLGGGGDDDDESA